MAINQSKTNLIYGIMVVVCFMPFISPSIALMLGILLSIFGVKHKSVAKYTSLSLQVSIILMGFGMNLTQVISASKTGFVSTAFSVVMVMAIGILLAKVLKVDSKIGILISAGTAICGGSAIAAVSPVLNAKNNQTSFALVVVFILNAIALVVFPKIGHYFNLSQESFGTWSAIAIHDTSSVVGAAAMYGKEALEVATTIKLIRALWIIPLSLIIAFTQKDKTCGKVKIPWFIALFIVAIILAHCFPSGIDVFAQANWLGKRGMVIALFLIGSSISFSEAKKAGIRSFVLGIFLWLMISTISLLVLTYNL